MAEVEWGNSLGNGRGRVDTDTQSHFSSRVTATQSYSSPRMRLSEMPVGARGRVCSLEGQSQFCQRLREMGFCESAVIEKVGGQHTLLCQICGTKIALSGRAGEHIVVELLTGGARA